MFNANTTESDEVQITTTTVKESVKSISLDIKPNDSRCKYWAKVVRKGDALPIPVDVNGANDIQGKYLKHGDEELFEGDLLFEGEANHHTKNRGWTYHVYFVDADGGLLAYQSGYSDQKAQAKAAGLPSNLLAGSGDVAGAVRVAHALRLGIKLSN